MFKKSFLTLLLAVSSFWMNAQNNALAIPDTLNGTNFNLTIFDTSKVFYNGFTTNTFGINADYLGPTLFLNQGDSISLNVTNTVADTTTIHWHGLHISPKNDGGPHTVIPPGTTWNPQFKVRDLAGTYWYHPHLHMKTNIHATKGAAGIIIVRDSNEAALNLPRSYGIDDFPLVIQSKAFDAGKQITVGNAYDSVVMVNGTLNPYLQVPAQVVRLRLLNASSDRVYNLGLSGNISFYQIGSDGGLLQAPVQLTRLMLAPGERAEILVDLSSLQGQTINLNSFASEFPNGYYGASNPAAMGPGTITGYSGNVLNGADFTLLQLQVAAPTANPVTSIPSALANVSAWSPMQANATRTLVFDAATMGANQMVNGPFEINNQAFDMNVINYIVQKDNIEIWELTNNTAIAHPFHIHGVQFYITEINGAVPPASHQGRKDVVIVPSQQTVKFITRFENFCDTIPYMYHCHMLKHEDDGMMGQFQVQCPSVGIPEITEEFLTVYPNPADAYLQIRNMPGVAGKLFIYDEIGKAVVANYEFSGETKIDVSLWAPGIYIARIINGKSVINRKIILH